MRNIILNQAEQILHSLQVNKSVRVSGQFDEIILAGMGGSGHPGDLLNALNLPTVPLRVHRSYGLPKIYGKKPLIIVSTYSGNTEESLSAYQEAKEAGYGLLANTAGGKLAELAQQDNVPLVKIDFPSMQPRHTLFASFTGLSVALANSGVAEDISEDLKQVAKSLEASLPTLEEPAQELAKKLKGTIPIYTSSNVLSFAAKNFKIQTNENTKAPAFWNEFPELNHNEMVGFTGAAEAKQDIPQNFHIVMLKDNNDHPRTKIRMAVTKELYEQWGLGVTEFEVKGASVLEKMFYAVSFGLWTTYFLAEEYGIDPVPVAGVENFKKRLEEIAGTL